MDGCERAQSKMVMEKIKFYKNSIGLFVYLLHFSVVYCTSQLS